MRVTPWPARSELYPNVRVERRPDQPEDTVTHTPTRSDTMHIGELADRTGLSLRTLRHYDEIGLLKASGRSEGGFRLYTASDLSRLMLIRRMKPLGFTLDEMAELLLLIDGLADGHGVAAESADAADFTDRLELRDRLDAFITRAVERRDLLEQQLAMADEFVELLRREKRETPQT